MQRLLNNYQIVTFDICRGTRIRTQTKGFGDLCTTLILFPYKLIFKAVCFVTACIGNPHLQK